MLLSNYLQLFRQGIEKLENFGYTESIEIKEEIRPNKQAIIKAKIILVDKSVLYMTLLIYSDFENQSTACCVIFKYYTQYT